MKISFKEHINQTFKLALPVSIGQLGHIMMSVVDSLMVGHVGSVPLAASSLANGLFFLIMVIGIGMSYAITSLVAIARGADDDHQCGVILRQGLLTNTVFSVILFIVTYFSAELISYFDQPADVAAAANSYLKILAYSIFPFMLFQTYRQFSEGLSIVKAPMVLAIIANIVNAFMNWMLIFGNLGAPELGLDGAGWATFTNRCFMGIAMMLYVIYHKQFSRYEPDLRFRKIDFAIIKKIIRIGLPSGFQYFFEVGAFTISAIMVGWLGSVPLAAHQIALNLASVSYMIILGIASAGNIRVGNAYGRRDISEIRMAGFSAVLLAVAIMSASALTFILLNKFLPRLYISEEEVVTLAASLISIAALFQLFDGIQAVGSGILRGIVDVKVPMYVTLIAYWVLGVPVGYILAFEYGYGAYGIWIGFLIGLAMMAIILLSRFHLKSKRILNSH